MAMRLIISSKISTNASYSLAEIVTAAPSGTPFYFQLYVNSDRAKSEALLAEAEQLGMKAIFVTIDSPVPGKREADERVKADEALTAPMGGTRASNDAKGGGIARIMGSFIDSSLNWEDLKWIRKRTKLPLVLKGVQSAADAKMAMDFGCEGILVSNHGGRNLDTLVSRYIVKRLMLIMIQDLPLLFSHF
jgi:L-lactate dehydrogenase (cytochrome)